MLSSLAFKCAEYFADKNVYSKDKVQIYKYGFELLISTILNFIIIGIIAALFGVLYGAVLFFLSFIPLRVTAGGYHANHHWSCAVTICTTFLVFVLICVNASTLFLMLYCPSLCVVSGIILWILSPIEAANKPLSPKKREKVRNKSFLLAGINMTIVFAFCLIPQLPLKMLSFYISGMFSACISLVAAYYINKFENKIKA